MLRGVAVLVVGLLLTGSGSAAPFLQRDVDAASTGFTDDPGPSTLTIGAIADLSPALPHLDWLIAGPPLIRDGNAWVHLIDQYEGIEFAAAIVRVDLDTLEPSLLWSGSGHGRGCFALAGEALLFGPNDSLMWLDPYTGEEVARVDIPWVAESALTYCQLVRVGAERIVVGAHHVYEYESSAGPGYTRPEWGPAVTWSMMSIDTASRAVEFHQTKAQLIAGEEPGAGGTNLSLPAAIDDHLGAVVDIAIGGTDTYVMEGPGLLSTGQALHVSVWLLDASGNLRQSRSWGGENCTIDQPYACDAFGTTDRVDGTGFGLAVSPNEVFIRANGLIAVGLDLSNRWWVLDAEPAGVYRGHLALVQDRVYVGHADQIVEVRVPEQEVGQAVDAPEYVANGGMIATPARVFTLQDPLSASSMSVIAWDRGTLERQATFALDRLGAEPVAMSVGDGYLAILTGGLRLAIIGDHPLGITFEPTVSTVFPHPHEPITIDLRAPSEGGAGNLTYIINWGNGARTVTAEPRVEYAYPEAGRFDVSILARNDAYQEAESGFAIHVGGDPPTFLSEAFSAENQESTFFILGIIVILLGSAFGAVRLRRKRGILRKELAKADAIVAANRDDPDNMRVQLREHRSRARRLFLDGRLDEGSTGILERHIDELLRDHRMSSVEAELSFLPHGLFRSMQEMLRDARVTQLERNDFLAALAQDKHLSAAERAKVKKHVETWHREDAA